MEGLVNGLGYNYRTYARAVPVDLFAIGVIPRHLLWNFAILKRPYLFVVGLPGLLRRVGCIKLFRFDACDLNIGPRYLSVFLMVHLRFVRRTCVFYFGSQRRSVNVGFRNQRFPDFGRFKYCSFGCIAVLAYLGGRECRFYVFTRVGPNDFRVQDFCGRDRGLHSRSGIFRNVIANVICRHGYFIRYVGWGNGVQFSLSYTFGVFTRLILGHFSTNFVV